MKTLEQRIEKLKKQAEKEGMKCEVVLSNPTFSAINTKDEWDFIELTEDGANFKKGQIFKVLDSHFSQFLGYGTSYKIIQTKEHGIWVNHLMIKPSTEQAYVNQLKAKAFELFGEIKIGEKFNSPSVDGNYLLSKSGNEEWDYIKKDDQLFYYDLELYRQGKWAKRVKERVKVDHVGVDYSTWSGNVFFGFSFKGSEEIDKSKVGKFLAEKLEEYLNKE
jgi:hypothetical protein